MEPRVYTIHKGISAPITFKGLQAQYILYAGVLLVGDLVLFAFLYLAKCPPLPDLAGCTILAFGGLGMIVRMNRKYGPSGWLKYNAAKKVPGIIRVTTRKIFTPPAPAHEPQDAQAIQKQKNHR